MLRIIYMNVIVVLNGKICSWVRTIPFLSQQKICLYYVDHEIGLKPIAFVTGICVFLVRP